MNLKKLLILTSFLFLIGCSSPQQNSEISSNIQDSNSIQTDSNSSFNSTSDSDTNFESSSSIQSDSSQSNSLLENNDTEFTPSSSVPNNFPRISVPANRDNFIELQDKEYTNYSFYDSVPDNWSLIMGYKKVNSLGFYSDGGLKFTMSNNGGGRGIQTPFFNCSLKLELRLQIGSLYQNGDKINTSNTDPVFLIYGFDENGDFLREASIDNISYKSDNADQEVKIYMEGTNLHYLELRMIRCPYKGSQGYNIQFLGVTLVSWPYAL